MSTPNSTPESLVNTVPELSSRVEDLTKFFQQSNYQSTWTTIARYQGQIDSIRFGIKEQAEKYSATVGHAIKEAENGQTIARKIAYMLGKIERDTRRDVLEDLLEGVQERVEIQVQNAGRVKAGFEAVRAGLLKIATQKAILEADVKDTVQQSAAEETNWKDEQFGSVVGAVLTVSTVVGPLYYMNLARKEGKLAKAAAEQVEVGSKALDVIEGLCHGIDDAIETVSKHLDFWSEINLRVTAELEQLGSADKLIKDNGRVKVAVVEESIDSWREVEISYRDYAAKARLSKQILEC